MHANDTGYSRPPVRLTSPMSMEGWPADFQPKCIAEVTFDVHAKTIEGEDIVILGNTVTLANGLPERAVSLDGDDAPAWTITLEQPANTEISYQYVRYESDGIYIYEDKNRTYTTGGCGSSHTLRDDITTKTPSSSKNRRSPKMLLGTSSAVEKRQQSGKKKGLPDRDLIDPPCHINNYAGSLSNKTIDTNLVRMAFSMACKTMLMLLLGTVGALQWTGRVRYAQHVRRYDV